MWLKYKHNIKKILDYHSYSAVAFLELHSMKPDTDKYNIINCVNENKSECVYKKIICPDMNRMAKSCSF